MENKLFTDLQQKWSEVGKFKTPEELTFEIAVYKKLFDVFQIGDSYYFTFCPPLGSIDYVSRNISAVLGYPEEEITISLLLENIHPDDLPYFSDFEATVVDFKMKLPVEKIMKYKTQYSFRIRKKDGDYLHVLQQSITIQCDEDGAVLRNLILHTDVSDIKTNNRMSLSFIGLDGEPSFRNVSPIKKYIKAQEVLTPREKEIVYHLSKSRTSPEIARRLSISPETVATHRKNIFAKTGVKSVIQLIMLAMDKGWLCLLFSFFIPDYNYWDNL